MNLSYNTCETMQIILAAKMFILRGGRSFACLFLCGVLAGCSVMAAESQEPEISRAILTIPARFIQNAVSTKSVAKCVLKAADHPHQGLSAC